MTSILDLKICIVGRGKVGQSLSQLLATQGHIISNIGHQLEQQIVAVKSADITLLCVNDDAIEATCQELCDYFNAGSVVAHCSGSLDSSVLNSAREQGCFIASCHPLNTFPTLDASLEKFAHTNHGSYLYSEGDDAALSNLEPIFQRAGFKINSIRTEAKILYHAACVFACNYLTALMDMSLDTADQAGIDKTDFWISLQPLIHATLDNITRGGTSSALSGPIARGDVSTIESHLIALAHQSTELSSNYTKLGMRSLQLAMQQGNLDKADIQAIRELLDQTADS